MSPLPQISNVAVKGKYVYLNSRVELGDPAFWTIPNGKTFILTDLCVQNRAPGDTPVTPGQFTRFSITSPSGQDTFFHVVDNDTLNLHFHTGLPISESFRFLSVGNSTAPFVEFVATGILVHDLD